MFINKTSEYSLQVLTYMAINENSLYTAQKLYTALGIPKRYLMRLLTGLSKSGFIESTRGRSGGYVFARPLEAIYFSEIIDSVQGILEFESCVLGSTMCPVDKPCAMHAIWEKARSEFVRTLKTTTLADLKNSNKDSFSAGI